MTPGKESNFLATLKPMSPSDLQSLLRCSCLAGTTAVVVGCRYLI